MKKNNFKLFVKLFFTIMVFIFLTTGCETTSGTPAHALVYVDHAEKLYIPPTYLQDNLIDPYPYDLITIGEAREIGYNPHPDAREQGYFMQEGRSLIGLLLEKIGVLNPLPSRWNEDGTWNW